MLKVISSCIGGEWRAAACSRSESASAGLPAFSAASALASVSAASRWSRCESARSFSAWAVASDALAATLGRSASLAKAEIRPSASTSDSMASA